MRSAEVYDNEERDRLLKLIHESLSIKSHLQFFVWLQVSVREFLSHDILIAAWGNFATGELEFDISSAMPGVRTGKCSQRPDLVPLLQFAHRKWLQLDCKPFSINMALKGDVPSYFHSTPAMRIDTARALTIHGMTDRRGQNDCLYVFIDYQNAPSPASHHACKLVLPHIDAALRRIDTLPRLQNEKVMPEASPCLGQFELSGREEEIMEWVCIGKTNPEISFILGISVNTVKNHLKRIFEKLDVSSRAQAVAKLVPYLLPNN